MHRATKPPPFPNVILLTLLTGLLTGLLSGVMFGLVTIFADGRTLTLGRLIDRGLAFGVVMCVLYLAIQLWERRASSRP